MTERSGRVNHDGLSRRTVRRWLRAGQFPEQLELPRQFGALANPGRQSTESFKPRATRGFVASQVWPARTSGV